MSGMSYQELAKTILGRFDWGIKQEELETIIDEAYGKQWHNSDITPVQWV